MDYENICFATEGKIALITLNRPQRRNALSLAIQMETHVSDVHVLFGPFYVGLTAAAESLTNYFLALSSRTFAASAALPVWS